MLQRFVLVTSLIALAPHARASSALALGALPHHFEPSGRNGVFVAARLLPEATVSASAICGPGGRGLKFLGADELASGVGEESCAGRSSWLTGSDVSAWRRGVPHFRSVRFRDLYPGIDVVHHARAGVLEHDLVVAPGADLGVVAFDAGAGARLDEGGNVVGDGFVVHAPIAWQELARGRSEVACRFVSRGNGSFGLVAGDHDPRLSLVVDPVLSWATYLSGDRQSAVTDVAACADGSTWISGWTRPTDTFPEAGASESRDGGYLVKLSADGSEILASTFLGVVPEHVVLGPDGSVHVTGSAGQDALAVVNAVQPTTTGPTAYLMKLDASASTVLYATYFGTPTGLQETDVHGLAVDGDGRLVFAGMTTAPIPVVNAAQPEPGNPLDEFRTPEAFVGRLEADGSALVHSTYLGGAGLDTATDLALDAGGDAYVVGHSDSATFPVSDESLRDGAGLIDLFLVRYSPAGALLRSQTYGGTGSEYEPQVVVDPTGVTTIFGHLDTAGSIPLVDAFETDVVPGTDPIFGLRYSPAGVLLEATYLTGGGDVVPFDAAIDGAGRTIVVGCARHADFPNVAAPPAGEMGWGDAFVLRLNADFDAIDFAHRFGGIGSSANEDIAVAVDLRPDGSLVVGGFTRCRDFPTTPGVLLEDPTVPDTFTRETMGFVAAFGTGVANVREPSAVDLRSVPPLQVARSPRGTELILGWEETMGGKDALYQGSIEALHRWGRYDHGPVTCDLLVAGATIAMPAGNAYFIAVATEGGVESSYGRDSFGRERPPATVPCR